jgi:Transposase DDE domain
VQRSVMPRRTASAPADHPRERAIDGKSCQLRGITGSSALKGHLGIDPDSELITATTVTAGNAGDAGAASGLLGGDLPAGGEDTPADGEPVGAAEDEPLSVYGDAAYGTGELLADLEAAGARNMCKVQPPAAAGGRFTKDAFGIDLAARTVTCPAGQIAPLRRAAPGAMACFGPACTSCPLAAQCTTAKGGRTIYVGPCEAQLAAARSRQCDPDWAADYRATRPKVERKIGHLMRRRHGGRRARVRGQVKVAADFALLAAAVNLARLSVLGLACNSGTWVVNTS